MAEGVAEILTSPSLNVEEVTALRLKVAQDDDERKAAETFHQDYSTVSKVIPAAEQAMRQGVSAIVNNAYPEALSLLEKESSDLGVLYRLQVLLALGKRTEAKRQLIDHKISTTNGAELIEFALVAMGLKANEVIAALATQNIDHPFAGLIGAFQNEIEGNYQEAIDALIAAGEQEGPYRGQALFHLAKLQERWGEEEAALETYRVIESLGYAFEESLVNTGILLEDRGNYPAALAYYEKALKINPGNKRVMLYHADAEACLDMYYDERKQRQDVKTSEILNIPISDFELSVRSRNCLSKMGIFTLKDLITKTEQELLSYKNFGETSLKEIRAMLAKKGLHLGMTRVEEQPLADRIKMNAQLYSEEREFSLDELDTPIEDLDLSYRTKSALHKMGFESLRDITMRTGTDLEANPNFSAACLQELNALLEEKGLTYRPATSSGKPEPSSTDGSALLSSEEESIFEYE